MKTLWFFALLCMGWVAAATDLKLETKELTVDDALALPTTQGVSARLVATKLACLRKEPATNCAAPLYGVLLCSTNCRMAFRLDKSPGSSHGYDQLIIDANGNGDLTDDQVLARVKTDGPEKAYPNHEHLVFGPFSAPAQFLTACWRPGAYAEVLLPKKAAGKATTADPNRGLLRLRTAAYLEAIVRFGNVSQKWGLLDGNGDFSLGRPLQNSSLILRNPTLAVASQGDFLMIDRNGSGKFEMASAEITPLVSLITYNNSRLQLQLSPDHSTLSVELLQQVLARQNQVAASARSLPPTGLFNAFGNGSRRLPGAVIRPPATAPRAGCPPSAPT